MAAPRALRVAPPAVVDGPLVRHAAPVTAVSIGPDGRLLATGDASGTLHLCDLEFGRATYALTFDGTIVSAAATSGVVGVVVGEALHLVHGFGGRVVGTIALPAPGLEAAASPDGMWIAALASEGTAVLVRTATGREKARVARPGATQVWFVDDRTVALQGAEGASAWGLPRLVAQDDAPAAPARGDVACVAHPSGQAAVVVDDGVVTVVHRS